MYKCKHKLKRTGAAILAAAVFTTTILPHVSLLKPQAFSAAYGVCIDNHNFSTAGSWSKNDRYSNKLLDMNAFTYGTPEYKAALAQNVNVLRTVIGSDEQILRTFWGGVATWISGGKNFGGDITEAQYWYNYAQQGYIDSVKNKYAPDISPNFVPMTETELGTILHGAAGQAIVDRDPFLKILSNPHTLFESPYDPNRNYETDPLALPRLSNGWRASYSTESGLTSSGRDLWPIDSSGHEVAGADGYIPTQEEVAKAALDMTTNKAYQMSYYKGSESESGDSANPNEPTEYVIDCTEAFFVNGGYLKVWNAQANTWSALSALGNYGQTVNIDGWDICPYATTIDGKSHWFWWFKYTGGNKPTGLTMYFETPKNSITDPGGEGFNSPAEFAARYMRLFTADACGGTHAGGKRALSQHQRFVSFYHSTSPNFYPCFTLGDPVRIPELPDIELNFQIYRHTEDWQADYNAQLDKYDYETGEPLENSVFELYERFDDKDQINQGHDGATELYEGISNDTDEEWQGKYTSSPVIWNDFRLVTSLTTDENGHIEKDVPKNYHYEKTFCDGHPSPDFAPVPEPETDDEGAVTNQDEIDAAKTMNKEAAAKWFQYYEDCIAMATENRPGVHFHWLQPEVSEDAIREVEESGGTEGADPNDQTGPTQSADLDTAYKSSGTQQDCQDTYDKFINLKYSYTWIEKKAREGYIRHDIHTDDVPIEVITTNSSQGGATSTFADEYSKDISINEDVGETTAPDTGEDGTDNKEGVLEKVSDFFSLEAHAAELDEEDIEATPADAENGFLSKLKSLFQSYFINTIAFFAGEDETEENSETASKSETGDPAVTSSNADEAEDEEMFADLEIGADSYQIASGSNASRKIARLADNALFTSDTDMEADAGEEGSEGGEGAGKYSAEYERVYDDAFKVAELTGGAEVELGPDDNWSHCNDEDGEGNKWRVYDHRTEGEIHFNKRDLYLADKEGDSFDSYGTANGDGDLEGAVYGLFARNDIEHPDGKTGVVYQADDLVAVATTDRNGDGSFLSITEAPGSVYNYETGQIEHTDWYANAPKNFYRAEGKTAEVQPNVTFTDGDTTEYYADDYTKDGAYKEALSQRIYDTNEENNGNSWIGRPLFLGEYYIKELSRSEGYELSVNGKAADQTNYGADLNNAVSSKNGSVRVNRNLYIQGQESIGMENEPFFEVASKGTNENGGYDVMLTYLPEGTKIYRKDTTTKKGTYEVLDHYENVPKVDASGNPVYKKATTEGIPKLKPDGSGKYMTTESEQDYILSDVPIAKTYTFNQDVIDEKLKGEPRENQGQITYPDELTMQEAFTMGKDSTYYIRFVKAKLEEALRTSGMQSPKTSYDQSGAKKTVYSQINYPIYMRGIRKGETDTFGISGVKPGEPASKTVYGANTIPIELTKTNSAGNPITAGDMIYNLLQYYMDHPYWSYGGVDRIENTGDTYTVYIYASNPLYTDGFVAAGTDFENDSVVYKAVQWNPTDTTLAPTLVFVPYTAAEQNDSFGTYSDLKKTLSIIGQTKASAVLHPDVVINGDGSLDAKMKVEYVTYEIGDTILDKDGNPVQDTESKPVYVTKEIDEVETNWTELPARYEDGKYIIHVDMPGTDAFGQGYDDADSKTFEFKAVVPEGTHALTQEEVDDLPANMNVAPGYEMSSGSYEVYVKHARAYAYLDYDDQKEAGDNSYIKDVTLSYPTDEDVFQDGDGKPGKGTIEHPIKVNERAITQKVKINKDIQTMETKSVWYCLNCGAENSEADASCVACGHERTSEEIKTITYAHDTYHAVHKENLPADGSDGKGVLDWLHNLVTGNQKEETESSIPNFRFKSYLKSNLERLYRDNDGNIVWVDRNGNEMTPQYEDTNGDGNYDTFTWKYNTAYDGKTVDWPEKDKTTEAGGVESANVQRIYTKVPHEMDSKTTSARSNNLWDIYQTPQGGNKANVGEKEDFNTSERYTLDTEQAGDVSGKAVESNASLYSYNGKNTDVAQSDTINEAQNHDFTRLLETKKQTVEDGAGNTREVESYNYEKFFDAINAANTDIWDNDMHSTFDGDSMENYPGQHWFETFYEKYQKDDTDPDHTIENTDGADADNMAGGDRDTSFKPFRWIREHVFGDRSDYEKYPAEHNGVNTEVTSSTSDFAKANAEASDAVRQFATKWYLQDEAGKLMKNNGVDENIAKNEDGTIKYDEAVYDEALFNAIAKAYNYLKPFYVYDLDTIYSVEWDTAAEGGSDHDFTTLSVDTQDGKEHYGISAYIPYGVYVVVEQQPARRDGSVNDWENRSYQIEKPKEVIVPSVYDAAQANDTTDNYDTHYNYDKNQDLQELAKKDNYLIRFGEEWSDQTNSQDEREFVIRAHNYHGDFEVYKYGLDIDRLNQTERAFSGIAYPDSTFNYAGWTYKQETNDPLKDYYDPNHRGKEGIGQIGTENGGYEYNDYLGIKKTHGKATANGTKYDGISLKDRFFYAGISEDAGIADDVMYKGSNTDDNNVSGMQWKDQVASMTGELTAYDGKYAQMLVPWSVTEPADIHEYNAADFSGYADVNERNGFYTTMLKINKVDSETGEYILHDNAIFALYAGSRYQSFDEIEQDSKLIKDPEEREAFLTQFKPGDAKFYLKDTKISGTKEFLMAMGATEITPVELKNVTGVDITDPETQKGNPVYKDLTETEKQDSTMNEIYAKYTGIVKKGTPIAVESERINLTDNLGAKTGQMTVYTTLNDVEMAGEEDPAAKSYGDQNTGYFVTPQPIGAGVYVLAEIKAPDGYARSKPIAYEVYSDKTSYYVDGDMYQKVSAVRQQSNLMNDINYEK